MDDGFGKIKVIPDYFSASSAEDSPLPSCSVSSSESLPTVDSNCLRYFEFECQRGGRISRALG